MNTAPKIVVSQLPLKFQAGLDEEFCLRRWREIGTLPAGKSETPSEYLQIITSNFDPAKTEVRAIRLTEDSAGDPSYNRILKGGIGYKLVDLADPTLSDETRRILICLSKAQGVTIVG